MDLKTSYEILEIDSQADENTIKKAYKAKVRCWHPDRFPQGSPQKAEAEEKLKQINIAYALVKARPARQRPKPADPEVKEAADPPPKAPSPPEEPSEKTTKRSWRDHLFDALNAFAGNRDDATRDSSENRSTPGKRKNFEEVLREMTGEPPLSGKTAKRGPQPAPRQGHATNANRYNRQGGGRVGETDPIQGKGPIKPVGRVRGIGRNR